MRSNIGNLHKPDLPGYLLPYGHIGRLPLPDVAVVPLRAELSVIGPVSTDRAAPGDLMQQEEKRSLDLFRQLLFLFLRLSG